MQRLKILGYGFLAIGKFLKFSYAKNYQFLFHRIIDIKYIKFYFFYFMLISDSFLHAQPKTASSSHTLQKNRFGCNSDLFF